MAPRRASARFCRYRFRVHASAWPSWSTRSTTSSTAASSISSKIMPGNQRLPRGRLRRMTNRLSPWATEAEPWTCPCERSLGLGRGTLSGLSAQTARRQDGDFTRTFLRLDRRVCACGKFHRRASRPYALVRRDSGGRRHVRTHGPREKKTQPDDVYAAVKAAFDGRAHGVPGGFTNLIRA